MRHVGSPGGTRAAGLAGLLGLIACGGAARKYAGGEKECAGADCPAGGSRRQAEVEPIAGSAAALIPRFPVSGSIAVTLHPGPAAELGRPAVVSFGAPFPPGALKSAGELRAFDRNGELPIHAAELLPWRAWPGRSGARPSVRAAMVSIEVTFLSRAPLPINLVYGSRPRATLPEPSDPRAAWLDVDDGEYPRGTVREPPVYATFSPDWLGSCLLYTRTTPVGRDDDWAWFDEALIGYARTAVNDVPDAVAPANRIPYTADAEPWLFDRSATLFSVYARTGDAKWLRHAHRSAQFYLRHIAADGHFDLKPDPDLKYAYGRSLLIDYLFTGDPALLAGIERVAAAAAGWNPVYQPRTSFWTERHQTYALLAALSAWEATGKPEHAARARKVAEASFAMAARPASSWQPEGCMLHTMRAHEGDPVDEPICSPWMSALFADAVWEYYIHTQDEAALEFLAGLGRYVARHALYPGGQGVDHTMPWYLASSVKTFSDSGPFDDVQHNCDVAGLVARAAWAEKRLGRDPGPLRATARELLEGCAWCLKEWHREGSVEAGYAEWRLSPARRFNWWFGTTSDLPWLMRATAR